MKLSLLFICLLSLLSLSAQGSNWTILDSQFNAEIVGVNCEYKLIKFKNITCSNPGFFDVMFIGNQDIIMGMTNVACKKLQEDRLEQEGSYVSVSTNGLGMISGYKFNVTDEDFSDCE